MKAKVFRSVAIAAAIALTAGPLAAQFDHYVALGDSLTAGVEGNCLVQRNQNASFPAVIAHQLSIGDFQQPLVQELAIPPLVGTPCLGAALSSTGSVTVVPISQMGPPLNSQLPRPYDNLGIPGARVRDMVDLTQGNPDGTTAERFSVLVLRNVPGSPFNGLNAVTEANSLGPDLVTLWIGNNDVLGAALNGVAIVGVTITPTAAFEAKYEETLSAIAGARTLVAGNIPDVTSIPFTTTIPPVVVNPATRQPVQPITPLLGPGNDTYPCEPVPPDQGCPLPTGTLVTLPASALLGQGIGIPVAVGGTGLPLPNGRFVPPMTLEPGVVLYPDEVALINEYVDAYNEVIAAQVASSGALFDQAMLVDIHSFFDDIAAHGYHIGGIELSTAFLSGGIFSADGFHASSIGYTIVADEIIQAMNAALDTAIPRPDFSHVLFTPNEPPSSSTLRGAGPWGYSLEMWSDLLRTAGAAHGMEVQTPEAPGRPRAGGDRGTRVVTRD